jgi:hypothetical protein
MSELQQALPTVPSSTFRLDVPLHSLLQQPPEKPSPDHTKHFTAVRLKIEQNQLVGVL